MPWLPANPAKATVERQLRFVEALERDPDLSAVQHSLQHQGARHRLAVLERRLLGGVVELRQTDRVLLRIQIEKVHLARMVQARDTERRRQKLGIAKIEDGPAPVPRVAREWRLDHP